MFEQVQKLRAIIFLTFILFSTNSFGAGGILPTVNDYSQDFDKSKILKKSKNLIKNVDKENDKAKIENQTNEDELKVLVNKFNLDGNFSISNEEIQLIIKDYLNKELTLNELDGVTEDITNLYIDKGMWARAVLPDQDITKNEITVEIIEARLGKIIIQKPDGEKIRFKDERAVKFLKNNQSKDKILSVSALNENIQTLDSLAGISATASLEAGEVDGETDIILEIEDQKKITGSFTADNHGSKSSGRGRASTLININSALHMGETITFQNVYTYGSNYYSLGVSGPIGYKGVTASLRGSVMDYNLGTPLKSTEPQGDSKEISLSLNFPTITFKNLTASFSFGAGFNEYLNRTTSGVTSEKTNLKSNLDINLGLVDNFLGGGLNTISLSFAHGEIDLGDNRSDLNSDSTTARTQGNYEKIGLNFSRTQILNDRNSLFFSTNGQYGFKNLDSAEQISLGGVNNVRGFPNSEASGTNGIITSLEHRFTLSDKVQTKLFYDFGKIKQYEYTYSGWNSSNTSLSNVYDISGLGFGLDVNMNPTSNLSFIYATKLSANPASDTNGNDNDGTDKKHRFWLSFNRIF